MAAKRLGTKVKKSLKSGKSAKPSGRKKTASGKKSGIAKSSSSSAKKAPAGTKKSPVKKTRTKKTAPRKKALAKKKAPRKDARKAPKEAPKKAPAKKKAPGKAAGKKRPASKKSTVKKKAAKTRAPALKPPFDAYKGTNPYIFVSYAHKDMKAVFRVIDQLHKSRYRIWFDEGIEPGLEWPEIVGKAVIKCTQFLVFMSPHAAGSRNVRNEINLAFSEARDILVVFLDETRLSEGMRLQIGTVQFINKFAMKENEFVDKLKRVLSARVKS
jgi:hypothetical protein